MNPEDRRMLVSVCVQLLGTAVIVLGLSAGWLWILLRVILPRVAGA